MPCLDLGHWGVGPGGLSWCAYGRHNVVRLRAPKSGQFLTSCAWFAVLSGTRDYGPYLCEMKREKLSTANNFPSVTQNSSVNYLCEHFVILKTCHLREVT